MKLEILNIERQVEADLWAPIEFVRFFVTHPEVVKVLKITSKQYFLWIEDPALIHIITLSHQLGYVQNIEQVRGMILAYQDYKENEWNI